MTRNVTTVGVKRFRCPEMLFQTFPLTEKRLHMVLAMEAREGPTIQEKGECLMEEFSRWFEEGLGSEVVSWFDVVHDHSLLPVLTRR